MTYSLRRLRSLGERTRSCGIGDRMAIHMSSFRQSAFLTLEAQAHTSKRQMSWRTPLSQCSFSRALLDTCGKVQAAIEERVRTLRSQTPAVITSPQLGKDTEAGKFLYGLSEESSLTTLDALTSFTDEDARALESLIVDLAADPVKAAAKLRATEARLKEAIEKVKGLLEATSDASFVEIARLRRDLDSKAELAKAASDRLFAAAPLPEIGSDLWRALWEAARRYSDEFAYPEKTFPDAEAADDLCVLCQQPLTPTAVERRLTFEEFVKGETKTAETTARQGLAEKLATIRSKAMKHDDVYELSRLIETELDEPTLAGHVRRCCIVARWRYRALSKGSDPGIEVIELSEHALNAVIGDLSERAAQLSSSDTSPERQAMRTRLAELKDRKALADIKEDVRAETDRLKRIFSLKKSVRYCVKESGHRGK